MNLKTDKIVYVVKTEDDKKLFCAQLSNLSEKLIDDNILKSFDLEQAFKYIMTENEVEEANIKRTAEGNGLIHPLTMQNRRLFINRIRNPNNQLWENGN